MSLIDINKGRQNFEKSASPLEKIPDPPMVCLIDFSSDLTQAWSWNSDNENVYWQFNMSEEPQSAFLLFTQII